MPKNRIIYAGILITAAAALLWMGALFLAWVKPLMPYFLGLGVLVIIVGIFLEARKKKSVAPGQESAESITETE